MTQIVTISSCYKLFKNLKANKWTYGEFQLRNRFLRKEEKCFRLKSAVTGMRCFLAEPNSRRGTIEEETVNCVINRMKRSV